MLNKGAGPHAWLLVVLERKVMNAKQNFKQPYFQGKAPLLDEEFDLYALEIMDLVIQAAREPEDPNDYIMGIGSPATNKHIGRA